MRICGITKNYIIHGYILAHTDVAQPEHAEEWYDQSKQIIVASYAKYLFEVLSKDLKPSKTDCYQWALDYRYAQVRLQKN